MIDLLCICIQNLNNDERKKEYIKNNNLLLFISY